MSAVATESDGMLHTIYPDGTFVDTPVNLDEDGEVDLKSLQTAVGGYVEPIVVVWQGINRQAYVDEDGKSKGLAFNDIATTAWHDYIRAQHMHYAARSVDVLRGPVAIWVPNTGVR